MNAIEINQLSKVYQGVKALDQVSLTIPEGEMFGLIGPNGAGKSTMIKLLLNMVFPTSGDAKLFGFDSVRDTVKIKKVTGYVPSDVRYYDKLTSREIFNYVADFHQLTGAEKLIADYLTYFSIDPDKKIAELSLGNKKKIALVAALIPEPKLLILDEPSNGLDPSIHHRLFKLLAEKTQEGMTVFLSSHDLHEVQTYCHRAAFIKEGRLVATENLGQGTYGGKRVTLTGAALDLVALEKLGCVWLSQVEGVYDFIYEGELQALLAFLNKQAISDITIRPLELADKFLAMYE